MSYPPQGGHGGGSPPANNMGLAVTACVLSFIAGCFPLGIFAIVQASQVNGKHQAGDHAGAAKTAASARKLSLISIGISVLAIVVIAILIVVAVANSDGTTTTY